MGVDELGVEEMGVDEMRSRGSGNKPKQHLINSNDSGYCDMSLVVRKPVFGVSDQVQHKPGCAVTEDS